MTAAFEIGFADVLNVLTRVFDIPADGRKALTSRLKHLQGKSFPPGVNIGRGGRVRYDADAVMGVVLVMALTSAFIPPNQAVDLVMTYRDEWRELLRLAARERLEETRRDRPPIGMIAVIECNALADLGSATPAQGRSAGLRGTFDFRTAPRDKAMAGELARQGAATLVDVPAILRRAAKAIAASQRRDERDILEAIASS